ncbi:MAG TPA: hypothetical protein VKR60_07030 [Candidatus Sulfotelmatobacter sp.]|nr:hypothetical protein [Candidatus Sulfotelmatobacter sp.]
MKQHALAFRLASNFSANFAAFPLRTLRLQAPVLGVGPKSKAFNHRVRKAKAAEFAEKFKRGRHRLDRLTQVADMQIYWQYPIDRTELVRDLLFSCPKHHSGIARRFNFEFVAGGELLS